MADQAQNQLEADEAALEAARLKFAALRDLLAEAGSLAVAFSGGVDSTFLLAAAREALGERVLAVSASSRAMPTSELEGARAFCAKLGVEQVVVDANELEAPGYRDNPPNRCYICKKALFGALWSAARERGFTVLADGSNLDDLADYRPGAQALLELDVRSPLREAGLTKADIRLLSREMGLPTWDKPSLACLSSRFPYGERITNEGLARVEAAERYLHELGFGQLRVRVHDGNLARIELEPGQLASMAQEPLRSRVHEHLKQLGFSYVSLDLRGYRTGSLNEVL